MNLTLILEHLFLEAPCASVALVRDLELSYQPFRFPTETRTQIFLFFGITQARSSPDRGLKIGPEA